MADTSKDKTKRTRKDDMERNPKLPDDAESRAVRDLEIAFAWRAGAIVNGFRTHKTKPKQGDSTARDTPVVKK